MRLPATVKREPTAVFGKGKFGPLLFDFLTSPTPDHISLHKMIFEKLQIRPRTF